MAIVKGSRSSRSRRSTRMFLLVQGHSGRIQDPGFTDNAPYLRGLCYASCDGPSGYLITYPVLYRFSCDAYSPGPGYSIQRGARRNVLVANITRLLSPNTPSAACFRPRELHRRRNQSRRTCRGEAARARTRRPYSNLAVGIYCDQEADLGGCMEHLKPRIGSKWRST